jgi:hypothetical protein
MLSYSIFHYLQQCQAPPNDTVDGNPDGNVNKSLPMDDNDDSDEGDKPEPLLCRISTDEEGDLNLSDQVEDYLHQDLCLSNITFYDFVCCYQKFKVKEGDHGQGCSWLNCMEKD